MTEHGQQTGVKRMSNIFLINHLKQLDHYRHIITPSYLLFILLLNPIALTCAAEQEPICQVRSQKNMVALTFDGGPDSNVPKILEILKKYDAKATFFVKGQNVKKYPAIARKMVESGSEVGNHGYTQPHLTELAPEQVKKEIENTQKEVQTAAGVTPKVFRPDYMNYNATIWKVLAENGLHAVNASTDIRDWDRKVTREQIIADVTNVAPGSIIRLHSWRKESSLDALPEILEILKGKGFQFVTVSEMIEGASGGQPNRIQPPYIIRASNDWQPFKWNQDIVAGSVLDFSTLLDAPAGKYGRLTVKGESFVFEQKPEVSRRFFGVNLSFWNGQLWDRKTMDRLAERLAKSGFNSIRLHAYDSSFRLKGKASTALDLKAMDHFDYLLYACKKQGIYTTIDMFVNRRLSPGEIPEIDSDFKDFHEFKSLIPVSRSAMQNWKDFTAAFLTHKNPYTGLRWVDDPALITISMVNENSIPFLWWRIKKKPHILKLYEQRFGEWCARQGFAQMTPSEKEHYRPRFMHELFAKAYEEMAGFVRALGARQPLTEQNSSACISQARSRKDYDYVDNHFYYDPPNFLPEKWRAFSFNNQSAILSMNDAQASNFPVRLFGKPFTCTEYNWVYPNRYRGEAGVLVGAYAALQNWSGLYLYEYSSGHESAFLNDTAATRWDLCNDPVSAISMRIGALLYLRGDVKTSAVNVPVAVDEKYLLPEFSGKYPQLIGQLGLVAKTGTLVYQNNHSQFPNPTDFAISIHGNSDAVTDCRIIDFSRCKADKEKLQAIRSVCSFNKGYINPESRYAKSSTGELELDGTKGTFGAKTLKSEVLIVPEAGEYTTGGALTVVNHAGFATIMASAMDGGNLASSKRILIVHLTDVVNDQIRFTDKTMKVLEHYGKLPHLMRKGEATLSLQLSEFSSATIRALDFTGVPLGLIKPDINGSRLSFKINTAAFSVPCMFYEILVQ